MAKKTKKIPVHSLKNPTKYYRATYVSPDGTEDSEVYISDSWDSAHIYAIGTNARGRYLKSLQEYDSFIDALT
jgi:hypothetical protein